VYLLWLHIPDLLSSWFSGRLRAFLSASTSNRVRTTAASFTEPVRQKSDISAARINGINAKILPKVVDFRAPAGR
jgi:hypothetical protein